METNIKISVIVPVYNTEKYIDECLESITNQTLKEIEILCINDGSTDNSLSILEAWKEKDKRIIVITKNNGGQSSARNLGLQYAKGDYISFIDSDDWIDNNYLEALCNSGEKERSDIVHGNLERIFFEEERKEKTSWINDVLESVDKKNLLDVKNKKVLINANHTCNKIYRRSFLIENKILFFEGLFWEDNPFVIMTTLMAKKMTIEKDVYYKYRIHSNGTTGTAIKDRKPFDIFEIMERLRVWFKEEKITENLEFEYLYADLLFSYLENFYMNRVYKSYKREFYILMKKALVNLEGYEKNYLKGKNNSFSIILNHKKGIYDFYNFNIKGIRRFKKMIKKILRKIKKTFILCTKSLKRGLIYLQNVITSIFKNETRYCVYGTLETEEWKKNYHFKNFISDENKPIKYSFYKPEYLFFEPFISKEEQIKIINKNKKAKKVFFSGECLHSPVVHPEMKKEYENSSIDTVDISLGFDFLEKENYIRYPLWILYYFKPTKNKDDIWKIVKEFNERSFNKTKFCSLVASHDKTGKRQELYDIVNSIDIVDCAGNFLHNDNSLRDSFNNNKELYLNQYKFNICPENFAYPGYVTEKLFQSLWSDSIPIYWGASNNPEPEVVNPKSFIYIDSEKANDSISLIKELHSNERSYKEFKKEPKLLESATDYIFELMKEMYTKFGELK